MGPSVHFCTEQSFYIVYIHLRVLLFTRVPCNWSTAKQPPWNHALRVPVRLVWLPWQDRKLTSIRERRSPYRRYEWLIMIPTVWIILRDVANLLGQLACKILQRHFMSLNSWTILQGVEKPSPPHILSRRLSVIQKLPSRIRMPRDLVRTMNGKKLELSRQETPSSVGEWEDGVW